MGGDDSDFIALGSGSDILLGGSGNDALYGDATFSGIHGQRDWFLNFNAKGQPVGVTQAHMTFTGIGDQSGGDYIDGGDGHDFILGGIGNDTLLGGNDNDDMQWRIAA